MVSDFVHHFWKWSKNGFKKNDFFRFCHFFHPTDFTCFSNSIYSLNLLARMNCHTIFEFGSLSAFRIWFQILSIIFRSGQKIDLKKMIFCRFLYFCIFASTSTDNFSVICLCRMNFCTNFEFSELSAFRIWFQILSIIFKNGQKMYLKKMIFPIFFMYSFTVCNSRGCFQLLSY